MTASEHPKAKAPSDADLKGNPGIGSSPGTAGEGRGLDGATAFEGDVANDSTPSGGADPDQRGRTNR